MLHFNATSARHIEEENYKILVLDGVTKDIVAPLLRVNELRRHGVTLHLLLESEREPIPDVPAIYFVHPSENSINRISEDVNRGLYASYYLNFSKQISRPLLEKLGTAAVKSGSAARISQVFDQHAQFVALEPDLFSLDLPSTYLDLNDPQSKDSTIENAVGSVVDGLFCVLATLGIIPIIRCPPGGAAEHIARLLDTKLRDSLRDKNRNIFSESSTSGLSASLQRPVLCLFDRNFELSVILQHSWTYKPLLQDVLHLRLNRIQIKESDNIGEKGMKIYDVDETDFFWKQHGREQFPKIAEQVETELSKYKSAVEDLNQATGANVDPLADPAELMSTSTKGLMSAVSSLPELTERKRVIDKHTNLATTLLKEIKSRNLDKLYQIEEELIQGKADVTAVVENLNSLTGSGEDKMRLALVWLLTCSSSPSDKDCAAVEAPLVESGVGMEAWWYVKRIRRMNLTGKGSSGPESANYGQSNISNLLETTFGQGLSSLTKGVKNLLAGEQQTAVTVAVESIMEPRQSPDLETFMTFDPRLPAGTHAQKHVGSIKEAIVFMVGGGNYLEAESLACWAERSGKNIIYGATELLNGEEMLKQLTKLGHTTANV